MQGLDRHRIRTHKSDLINAIDRHLKLKGITYRIAKKSQLYVVFDLHPEIQSIGFYISATLVFRNFKVCMLSSPEWDESVLSRMRY